MKLWLISQVKNKGYDTYSDAVVAAETETEAKMMHPRTGEDIEINPKEGWEDSSWTNNPNDVIVEYLGEAVEGTLKGVMCASFHAG